MDMNFPHPRLRETQRHRDGGFAVLVATAVARQMAGATTWAAASGSTGVFGKIDPLGARMKYFASRPHAGAKSASGSFLPLEIADLTKVNKIRPSVYPDALAYCKPYLLDADKPEQPVALRGMEKLRIA